MFMRQIILTRTALLLAGVASTALPQQAARFNDNLLGLPPVKGAAFSGAETIQSGSAPPRLYRVYRDSEGRTATVPAISPTAYNPNLIEIDDPVMGNWYIVDQRTKIVHVCKLPPQRQKSAAPSASAKVLSLGSLTLFGVETEGTRVYVRNNWMVEQWRSKDLQMSLIVRTVTDHGTAVTEFTDLTLGEPPSSVFQVPSGFSRVDEISPFAVN